MRQNVSAVAVVALAVGSVLLSFFRTVRTIMTIGPLRGWVSVVVSAAGCWCFVRNHLNCLKGLNCLNCLLLRTITRSGITLLFRPLIAPYPSTAPDKTKVA